MLPAVYDRHSHSSHSPGASYAQRQWGKRENDLCHLDDHDYFLKGKNKCGWVDLPSTERVSDFLDQLIYIVMEYTFIDAIDHLIFLCMVLESRLV